MAYEIQNTKYKILFLIIFFGIFGLTENSKAVYPVADFKKFLLPKFLFSILILFVGLTFTSTVYGANIYVDQNLVANCTTGNYSTANHNCSGSEGNAYTKIRDAVNAMNGGDDIYLRDGRYLERDIYIDPSKSGTENNWSSIQSYPNEWAIVDGQRLCTSNTGAIFRNGGYYSTGSDSFAKYWLFERLEITGGGDMISGIAVSAAGIWWNKGPVTIRYCYIHDNLAASYDSNPAGFSGGCAQWATIEYCYFKNNGSVLHEGENSRNIITYGNTWYVHNNEERYTEADYARNNVIQYNRVEASNAGDMGIATKAYQRLTPTRDGTDMTHSTWGDKIHHNILTNVKYGGINWMQDYAQVYNNIVVPNANADDDLEGDGIVVTKNYLNRYYQMMHYVVYNNTIIGSNDSGIQNSDLQTADWEGVTPVTNYWCLNNLIDSHTRLGTYRRRAISFGTDSGTELDVTGVHINGNYIFQPDTTELVAIDARNWTGTSFNSTFSPEKIYYRATENPLDLLYQGTSGADQYRTRGEHVMEGTTKIKEGGLNVTKNNAHPYLAGVKIPVYVGATNPTDDAWVAGVYTMNADWFKTQENGSTPDWIEGENGTPGDTTPPANPTGLSVS